MRQGKLGNRWLANSVSLPRYRRVRCPDVAMLFPLPVRSFPDNNIVSCVVDFAAFTWNRIFTDFVGGAAVRLDFN